MDWDKMKEGVFLYVAVGNAIPSMRYVLAHNLVTAYGAAIGCRAKGPIDAGGPEGPSGFV